jgi:hypothetical protein
LSERTRLREERDTLKRENTEKRQAISAHYCIECGNTRKVRDPMAWNDRPEDYHDCGACKDLLDAARKEQE